METTGPIPRRITQEDASCCVCENPKKPVDLTRACIVWRNGKVAHVDCYNAARLAPKGKPAQQTELGAGGAQ